MQHESDEPDCVMQAQAQHLHKLLAHALPPTMTDAEVAALFPADAPIVQAIERQVGQQRRALVVFASAGAAKQAFQSLQGPESTDMGGHKQVRSACLDPVVPLLAVQSHNTWSSCSIVRSCRKW